MKIYGIKTCDTCQKARKSLPDAQFIDVRDDGIAVDLLESALAKFGEQLLNTRSTTWRNLPEGESGRPVMDLLLDHPTLMKRPLIAVGGTYYLGWSPEVQAALVGG